MLSTVEGITLTGASPDFTREQFLAHSQAKINAALNNYAVTQATDTVDGASALGVSNQLFARVCGFADGCDFDQTQIVNLQTCNLN